jgi:hypothetical protein
MAFDVKQLTRNELAMFLPNQRAISAFENLFNVPNSVDANAQEISDANLNSAAAEAKAQIALDTVSTTKVIADNAQASANAAQTSATAAQISANEALLEITDVNLNIASIEAKLQVALDSSTAAQASANAAQASANAAQISADQALIESSLLILAPPLVI